ncbi:MAG: LUD domain-containing protein [Dietzia sp.]|uniref:LutC/YkgG family protein n=1 Tax=Nostocoides sp. F2B08 TaxID=2653936 RepID=UPI001263B078|nr:LUD domain-containing protein [Tetrasphaera sp. F2B08]KAB7741364.1 lactate utilization protein C [Tetrasphaera sp. F2B08]MBC7307591.1 LUD domain-containing protein [Dietzia sp.]
MSAREDILVRVRGATADVVSPMRSGEAPPVIEEISPSAAETLELFAENVADYRAQVLRVEPGGVADAIAGALREHGCGSVVVPGGLDEAWVGAIGSVATLVPDSLSLTSADLDGIDGVVTASAVGIATTGTIVLDHREDQGRRAITLVPDTHICVIRADQVVHDVPESVRRLRPQPGDVRPLTWISGPSATSDIELERVEGVHGPRTLVVVLATG